MNNRSIEAGDKQMGIRNGQSGYRKVDKIK